MAGSAMNLSKTLHGAYESLGKRNGLNFIRLLLAGMVVVHHSFPITGADSAGLIYLTHFGSWAVNGFFAISGYLIAMSWLNSRSNPQFIRRRLFRIFPAFWVALLTTAFLIAPLYSAVSGSSGSTWMALDAVKYVATNSLLLVTQPTIGTTLESAQYPQSWNGSLWTLAPEFICYMLLAFFFTIARGRARLPGLVSLLVISIVTHLLIPLPFVLEEAGRLGIFFLAGTVVFMLRDKIKYRSVAYYGSAAAVLAVWVQPGLMSLASLPMAYFLLWTGVRIARIRLSQKNDYSYGLYVYAFPVQQSVAGIYPEISLTEHILVSLIVAFVFAVLSWHLIERPAINRSRVGGVKPKDA